MATVDMMFLDFAGNQGADPYWANVSLLVQGGTDGGTLVQDLSSYASSVTITADATFESSHQVFGNNAIRGVTISPTIPAFTSAGVGSRFSRPVSEDLTIECWFYYTVLENYSTSSFMWHWSDSVVGRIAELGTNGSAGNVRLRIEDSGEYIGAALAANTLHFLQLTVSGNTYYLDVNGTQVVTGTFPNRNNAGTYSFRVAAQTPQAVGTTNRYWSSPIRVTKGIARARGTVPTAPFPTF